MIRANSICSLLAALQQDTPTKVSKHVPTTTRGQRSTFRNQRLQPARSSLYNQSVYLPVSLTIEYISSINRSSIHLSCQHLSI